MFHGRYVHDVDIHILFLTPPGTRRGDDISRVCRANLEIVDEVKEEEVILCTCSLSSSSRRV